MAAVSTVPRRRTPIVFVAYGDEGIGWLRALRARCSAGPEIRALAERGVVQFWCIGAADGSDGIIAWPALPSLPDVAGALDRARSAQMRAEFPDLDVRDVRIIERVSLFAPDIADLRAGVRAVLDAVPDVEGQARQGQQAFRYRWVALADTIHEPTRVAPEAHARAFDAALAAGEQVLTLLVDRQDSDVAVLDQALATRCFAELAMAYAQGDLGAPRTDGVPATIPDIVDQVAPGRVVPFGVAVLEHPWREIAAARVRAFRQRLAAGVADRQGLDQAFGRPGVLLDAIREDRAALDGHRYDRHVRRRVREEALVQTIAWALADGDARYVRGILDDVHREIAELRQVTRPMGHPVVRGALLAPVAVAQGPAQDGTTPALLAALGVALLAAVAALLVARRRRSAATAAATPADPSADRTSAALLEDVQREWEQLCRRLDGLLTVWEQDCRTAREVGEPAHATDVWQPAPPVAWRLSHRRELAGEQVPVTPELCRDVARQCAALLDDRTPAATALEEACRRELQRWDARRQPGHAVASAYVRGALAPEHVTRLRRFVETRPYLANPTTPPAREAVVWLAAPALALESSLLDLEQVAAREAASVLSHDDDERSVRLSFARPVPWHAIPSLAARPSSATPADAVVLPA